MVQCTHCEIQLISRGLLHLHVRELHMPEKLISNLQQLKRREEFLCAFFR